MDNGEADKKKVFGHILSEKRFLDFKPYMFIYVMEIKICN